MITMTQLICDNCKKEFSKSLTLHNHSIKRGDKHTCCSKECSIAISKTNIDIECECEQCHKKLIKKIYQINRANKKSNRCFCNAHCSAIYNNSRRLKKEKPQNKCVVCSLETPKPRKYCESHRPRKSGTIGERTKGELFKSRKNWQCARSAIRRHAEKIFDTSNVEHKCLICSYNKHVEICHKKSVSDFSDDTLIKVINDISNLVPLCRNHHWEFDNDLLILP